MTFISKHIYPLANARPRTIAIPSHCIPKSHSTQNAPTHNNLGPRYARAPPQKNRETGRYGCFDAFRTCQRASSAINPAKKRTNSRVSSVHPTGNSSRS